MVCGGCGVEVQEAHNYCASCGASLKASMDQVLLDELSDRVAKLDQRLPRSMVVSRKFWQRAIGIMGHLLAATLPMYLPILLIATLAIPSLLRSRQAANEAGAVSTLRTIAQAETTYAVRNGQFGTMAELIDSQLLDESFRHAMGGYQFEVAGARVDNYMATAEPVSSNLGRYAFFVTRDGVIRYSSEETAAPANLAGEPIR